MIATLLSSTWRSGILCRSLYSLNSFLRDWRILVYILSINAQNERLSGRHSSHPIDSSYMVHSNYGQPQCVNPDPLLLAQDASGDAAMPCVCGQFQLPESGNAHQQYSPSHSARHIDRVIVTDAEIDQCDADNFVGCPEDSTFCLSAKNVVGSWRFTVGKCINRFFVYLYMEDFEESDITAKIMGDKGCDNIAETDYTTCASVPLGECGLENTAEAEDECNRNCFRLECTYLDALKKNRTSFEACLPSFLQPERFNEMCISENSIDRPICRLL